MEFDIADPPSPQLWIVPKKNLNEGFPQGRVKKKKVKT